MGSTLEKECKHEWQFELPISTAPVRVCAKCGLVMDKITIQTPIMYVGKKLVEFDFEDNYMWVQRW